MPTDGRKLVTPRLISEHTALVPGQPGMLAVELKIAPKWHLYWRNPGDSGLPVACTFETPDGITVGEPQWPMPVWHESPGDILDFVHEGTLTLLYPVEIATSVPAGTEATISASISWLVCDKVCLPGDGEASITLPVAPSAKRGPDAAAFDEARKNLPRELTDGSGFAARASGSGVVVEAPGCRGLTFFPYEPPVSAAPVRLLQQGRSEGSRLEIEFERGEVNRVRGVAVAECGGARRGVVVDIPLPGP